MAGRVAEGGGEGGGGDGGGDGGRRGREAVTVTEVAGEEEEGREAAAKAAVGTESVCVPGLHGSLTLARSPTLTCLVCTEARDVDVLPNDSEAAAEPVRVRVRVRVRVSRSRP